MVASFVSSFTSSFLSLPGITQILIVGICIGAVLMAGPLYNNRTLVLGPTVLTMAGIFGCFLGIALGLMEFRTNDIQGSVPDLVDGIKTAFWISVTGVGGALLIKLRMLIVGPPRIPADGSITEATVDDLAALLRTLHQSLAGNEDSTLLSQTKLLRQENRDNLLLLKSSLDSCLEKLADSNSKALIEALKEVIRDFNAKINEQFGDNFKQLNAAVERILVWQQNYRQQISEMIEQQTVCAANMTTAAERYGSLIENAEAFTSTATALNSLIETLEMQRDQVRRSIDSLGTLLKSAGDNLPKIESQVLEMARQIEVGVRASHDAIKSTVVSVTQDLKSSQDEMKRLLLESARATHDEVATRTKQFHEQISEVVSSTAQALQASHAEMKRLLVETVESVNKSLVERASQLHDQTKSAVTAIEQAVQQSHSEMKRLLADAAETTHKDMNAHIKQLSENTQKQVVALDKALSDELTKSIQTLGEHLTALSRRFVEDYTPLTESLRSLIQTARRVQ